MLRRRTIATDLTTRDPVGFETSGNRIQGPGHEYDADELESDYYRELDEIESKENEVDTQHALQTWVPLLAAGGSIVITAMLLFKGLKSLDLDINRAGNILIMLMVGAAVWMAVFISSPRP